VRLGATRGSGVAIRDELERLAAGYVDEGPEVGAALKGLEARLSRLLDLALDGGIDERAYAAKQDELVGQIAALRVEADQVTEERARAQDALAEFSEMADLLARLDIEEIWQEASAEEQRQLACELIECVRLYPDQLRVQVAGAPEITVTLEEAGLRAGSRSVVSEGRPQRSPSGGSGPGRHNDPDPGRIQGVGASPLG
jgi:hypothetical protein